MFKMTVLPFSQHCFTKRQEFLGPLVAPARNGSQSPAPIRVNLTIGFQIHTVVISALFLGMHFFFLSLILKPHKVVIVLRFNH